MLCKTDIGYASMPPKCRHLQGLCESHAQGHSTLAMLPSCSRVRIEPLISDPTLDPFLRPRSHAHARADPRARTRPSIFPLETHKSLQMSRFSRRFSSDVRFPQIAAF